MQDIVDTMLQRLGAQGSILGRELSFVLVAPGPGLLGWPFLSLILRDDFSPGIPIPGLGLLGFQQKA